MKIERGTGNTGRWIGFLTGILWPGQAATATSQVIGQWTRQGLALILSALMIVIPMGLSDAFAESVPRPDDQSAPAPDTRSVPRPPENSQSNPPDADAEQSAPAAEDQPPAAEPPAPAPAPAPEEQPAPKGQPLSAEQLDQLVAPIALYPDALVAQILAAATYPTQVVEADRWRKAQGDAPPEQIAAGAERHSWDPSVKALTAFPSVLAQMDRNIGWTTDLGNAYYNQPQDVMDSVQAMRHKAQAAGHLRSTPQQAVNENDGAITIAPATPTVVYVPVYDPWVVYGSPFPVYPGYYYYPPPGIFWGGLAIGFGVGIGIGYFSHWGWGWGHWGVGWYNHAVFYNHATYITHSTTVINRGFGRPGGPPAGFGARGAYVRASVNRSAGYHGPSSAYRRAGSVPRPGGAINRSAAGPNRPAGSYGRPAGGPRASSQRASVNRASRPSSSGHSSGGSHSGGSHSSSSHGGHGR